MDTKLHDETRDALRIKINRSVDSCNLKELSGFDDDILGLLVHRAAKAFGLTTRKCPMKHKTQLYTLSWTLPVFSDAIKNIKAAIIAWFSTVYVQKLLGEDFDNHSHEQKCELFRTHCLLPFAFEILYNTVVQKVVITMETQAKKDTDNLSRMTNVLRTLIKTISTLTNGQYLSEEVPSEVINDALNGKSNYFGETFEGYNTDNPSYEGFCETVHKYLNEVLRYQLQIRYNTTLNITPNMPINYGGYFFFPSEEIMDHYISNLGLPSDDVFSCRVMVLFLEKKVGLYTQLIQPDENELKYMQERGMQETVMIKPDFTGAYRSEFVEMLHDVLLRIYIKLYYTDFLIKDEGVGNSLKEVIQEDVRKMKLLDKKQKEAAELLQRNRTVLNDEEVKTSERIGDLYNVYKSFTNDSADQ